MDSIEGETMHVNVENKSRKVKNKNKVKYRGGWSHMHKLYEIVSKNKKCAKVITRCGLNEFLKIDVSKDDQQLVDTIVKRWRKYTNTFHFLTFEIGFTPNDFSWLTGIGVGLGVKLDYISYRENREQCVLYLGYYLPSFCEFVYDMEKEKQAKLMGKDYVEEEYDDSVGKNGLDVDEYLKAHSGGIPLGDLCKWLMTFAKTNGDGMKPCWDEIVRGFLLWLIGQVLLPNSGSCAKVGWLVNFENLKEIKMFDWGSPTMACIYKALGEVSSRQKNTFNGMWMVLEYWFWYYFHTLTPEIKGNAPVWKDLWPKITVFNKKELASDQVDLGRHSKINASEQLELRSIESTTWQPWLGSEHADNEVLKYSLKLSSYRCVFLDVDVAPQQPVQ